MPKPVIFLAFANDREDNARYLRNLTQELHQIEEALQPLKEFSVLPVSKTGVFGFSKPIVY